MIRRGFAFCSFLLAGLGCDRQAPTPAREAVPTAPSSSSAELTAQALSESDAIARVQALPEFKALSSQEIAEGKGSRKMIPRTRVVSTPRLESTSEGDHSYWEIVIDDQSRFDADGGLTNGEPAELDVRVDAFTGAISVRNLDGNGFRDYAAWAAAQRGWNRAVALVMSTPEWNAEAAVIRNSPDARTIGAALGLVFGQEPRVGCSGGTPDCRYSFSAMRVCGSCAGGRWVEFEVDLSRRTMFINDGDLESPMPYGKWRHYFRAQARKQNLREYQPLLDRRRASPEYRMGDGPLGYGKTLAVHRNQVSLDLRAALERGGYTHLRTERYAGDFPVYVVRPTKPSVPSVGDFRTWGASLVRANGGRACEVAVEDSNERFQFDGFALKGNSGGVYVFVDGDFHPWLRPE
jgi:hypothetical protein